MMAMKYFRPSLRLTRGLEFDIWREANLVESYGTSKEGLALAAARRGFDVYTMGKRLHHSFVDAIADKIPRVNYQMLELLYEDTRKKFRTMRLRDTEEDVTLPTLKQTLSLSHIPILLTSTALFGSKEDLPHWVTLVGYLEDAWYVNNPLAKSPSTRIKQSKFEGKIGYRGIECAVVVRGLRNKSNSR